MILYKFTLLYLSFFWRCGPTLAMASSSGRFLDNTQRRTTVGRTPLDERSARRRTLLYIRAKQNIKLRRTGCFGEKKIVSAGNQTIIPWLSSPHPGHCSYLSVNPDAFLRSICFSIGAQVFQVFVYYSIPNYFFAFV